MWLRSYATRVEQEVVRELLDASAALPRSNSLSELVELMGVEPMTS